MLENIKFPGYINKLLWKSGRGFKKAYPNSSLALLLCGYLADAPAVTIVFVLTGCERTVTCKLDQNHIHDTWFHTSS